MALIEHKMNEVGLKLRRSFLTLPEALQEYLSGLLPMASRGLVLPQCSKASLLSFGDLSSNCLQFLLDLGGPELNCFSLTLSGPQLGLHLNHLLVGINIHRTHHGC